jgi:hypothetical protein
VIAEGNETPGGESGGTGGRRSEGDLLAERRARRAAESGEHALTMRAEAAEATVRTLETHVASLQQRLGDAEQESRRIADLLDAERAPRLGERAAAAQPAPPAEESVRERELQRASQREYAEQRLRVEAEDRGFELERESRAEIDRLNRRLSASERETQALGARLEVVQRELAEAEQAAATERSAMLRSERALRARLGELEGAALELHSALETERAARRRAEYLLDALREAHRGALGLLGGLADTIGRLRGSFDTPSAPALAPAAATPIEPPPPIPEFAPPAEAAPRAPTAPPGASPQPRPLEPEKSAPEVPDEVRSAEMAEALAAAVERLRARVEQQEPQHEQPAAEVSEPVAARPSHKHSMSLIGRTRLALRRRREARKQRREA